MYFDFIKSDKILYLQGKRSSSESVICFFLGIFIFFAILLPSHLDPYSPILTLSTPSRPPAPHLDPQNHSTFLDYFVYFAIPLSPPRPSPPHLNPQHPIKTLSTPSTFLDYFIFFPIPHLDPYNPILTLSTPSRP